jgi:hypothetical protein
MKVLNPTGWDIEGMADSVSYCIPAFSELEIWNDKHALHLCRSQAHKGLVHLAYTPEMQQKYSTYEEFVRAQRIKGLKAVIEWKTNCKINEYQALRDVRENGGSEADKATMNPEKFEKQIREAEKWLKEAESFGKETTKKDDGGNSDGVSFLPADEADKSDNVEKPIFPKRRGRRRKYEPIRNKDESTAQVG